MVTDSVADALIRIKNAYLARKNETELNYSKVVLAICQVLIKEGYLITAKAQDGRKIKVELKYNGKEPALSEVKRVSKPGLRIYKSNKSLPKVLGGLGLALISTPKGVMTDRQARKEGVGGEVLAYVW